METSGFAGVIEKSAEPSRLENWSVVGRGADARLFGLLRERCGELQCRWFLSEQLALIDFRTRRAETVDGAAWELWTPLLFWPGEARTALRVLAERADLAVSELDANAMVREGEDLGDVSDAIAFRASEMARVMGVIPPRRNMASIQEFNRKHGATYLSNRERLLRERDQETVSDRRDAKIMSWSRFGMPGVRRQRRARFKYVITDRDNFIPSGSPASPVRLQSSV